VPDEKKQIEPEPPIVPPLTKRQKEEAEERTSVTASIVHEAIRKDGDEELHRPVSALAWSGLAAGLSMGFSFIAEAIFRTYLPDAHWRPLIAKLGYPLGFVIAIMARQQLFTENTLTAIIPLLARRNFATGIAVARLWAVVLAANLAGAHIFAWVVADTNAIPSQFHDALNAIAISTADVTFGVAMLRGVFAGWLIAMVVWMLAAVEEGRLWIIIILTYIVAVAGFTHVIAGSVEVLYLVVTGVKQWTWYAGVYMVPTLLGNIVGGVALVSALNHAQVVAGIRTGPAERISHPHARASKRESAA